MKTAHEGQLMLSIGALLASEREKRGIPVERAAKETRMRPQRIRDMEADDLSHFTNPSYARMFLIAYAKYLGIPMKTICDHLPDRGESASEGYQYISTSTEELPSLRHDLASKPARRNNTLYALAITTLAVVLLGVIGLGYYLVVNTPRLTAAVEKPPPTPEPTPPPPQIIVREAVVLNNIRPDGSITSAFDGEYEMEAPSTPAPSAMRVSNPAPALNTTSAPAPATTPAPSAAPDDQAFLLGASPDAEPGTIQ